MINIKEVLELHAKFLSGDRSGVCANLEGANLEGVSLRYVDFRYVNLTSANLRGADLRGADLTRANLTGANLEGSNLEGASIVNANLKYVDFRRVNLKKVKIRLANLRSTKFTEEQTASIQRQILSRFEKNSKGNYIAYKTFGFYENGDIPKGWVIKQRRIIEEPNIECSNLIDCGPGINVGTLDWVRIFVRDYSLNHKDIWKVELLCDPVVPLASNGKIRCEKVKLIRIVK